MNGSDRQLLLAVSGLLHYPDDDFFVQARSIEELCGLLSVVRAYPLREFIRSARSKGFPAYARSTSPFSIWTASAACPLHGIGMGTIPGLGALWRA